MLVFVALERATGITSMQLKCFVFPASTPLQVLSAHYSTWSIIVTKKKMQKNSFSFHPEWINHWVCPWQKTC